MEDFLSLIQACLCKSADIIGKYQLQLYWRNGVRSLTVKKNILSRSQTRQIQTYFAPYFKVDYSTHAYLYEKTGRFAVNYIPYYIHYTIIDPYFNDWKWAAQNANKCFQRKLFGLEKHEMPQTIAYRCNDIWYDSDDNIIGKEYAIKLISEGNDVFVKPASGSCGGKGIMRLTPIAVSNCSTECIDNKSIVNIIKDYTNDIIVQKTLTQSPTLSQINSSSINTVRCMSLLMKTGEVKIVSCILRVGAKGSVVDNLHSGGFCIGIDESGKLMSLGYTIEGKTATHHPDSGVEFQGIQIPSFSEMKKLVSKAHRHVPKCRLVSWDIAFDENENPILVEGNLSSGGIGVHQLSKGPIFGDDTIAILNEVYGKGQFHNK